MQINKFKFFGLAVLLAIIVFPLGRVIWTPSPEIPTPSAGQLPFFIGMASMEAIAFGIGVSFLLVGWRFLCQYSGKNFSKQLAGYLAIGWLLVSWWPHDNLHLHIGHDLQKLLYIEYGFHLTLILAGFILAYLFLDSLKHNT